VSDEIRPYRIGWGRLTNLAVKYRRLLPMIIRGRQGDGQKVPRRRWWPMVRRDLLTVLTHHPKCLIHLPWQAEADDQRFARRGLTAEAARRRMVADVDHEWLHGERSPYQARRWCRVRRWDRKNLPRGTA
jgi:hypothetical protein